MTSRQKKLIRAGWLKMARVDQSKVSEMFFDRLFDISPEFHQVFVTNFPESAQKLHFVLNHLVEHIGKTNEIRRFISPFTQYGEGCNISRYQFAIVGNALLWTLEQNLQLLWTDEMEDAWASLFIELSETIITSQAPQRIRA